MTDVTFTSMMIFSVLFLAIGMEGPKTLVIAIGLVFALLAILTTTARAGDTRGLCSDVLRPSRGPAHREMEGPLPGPYSRNNSVGRL